MLWVLLLMSQWSLRNCIDLITVWWCWTWYGSSRCYRWSPCWTTPLYCNFKRIARTNDYVLCIFMSETEHICIVHFDYWVTGNQASLVGNATNIDLKFRREIESDEKCLENCGLRENYDGLIIHKNLASKRYLHLLWCTKCIKIMLKKVVVWCAEFVFKEISPPQFLKWYKWNENC